MSLVKWFRKNNKKVMAVVVIIIMFGFIGGPALRYLGRGRIGANKTVAYFASNREITDKDLVEAQRELEILRMLRADVMFRYGQDLGSVLLGQLLFAERNTSGQVVNELRRRIRAGRYIVSDKQINDICGPAMPSNVYWLLLKKEAEQAGIEILSRNSGEVLSRIIPQLFGGTLSYPQLIQALVKQRGVSEDEILTTFGKLLTVLDYSRIVCSGEDVTDAQIRHNVSLENETLDVEFVKVDSELFADTQPVPKEQRVVEHFDRYEGGFAGSVSEENPYGFGYKLFDRAELEYIVVKLDDVSTIVTEPTQEEAEEFYQRNRERFAVEVPSDPNDPNSPPIQRIRSYSELASLIREQLLQNRIDARAGQIIQQARTLTEEFEEVNSIEELSSEERARVVGGYEKAGVQLSLDYGIKVYTGSTGLLSAVEMQNDEYLGRVYVKGVGNNIVFLPQAVFAIDELAVSELGPFDIPKPRMYGNIGPLRDFEGRVMMIARIIKAEKASEPEDINVSFSKRRLEIESDQQQKSDQVYSIREKVVEDLKKLTAMETAKSKAEELVRQVAEDGWEEAVSKFNERYGNQPEKDEGEPNAFELQSFSNMRKMSKKDFQAFMVQSSGNPIAQYLINEAIKNGELIEAFFSLVPKDTDLLETVPFILEFKPYMSYYVIKQLSRRPVDRGQFESIKVMQAYRADLLQSQSLSAVHFGPENITKRMNFRRVKEEEPAADVNMP